MTSIVTSKVERAERIEGSTDMVLPRIGEWYWLQVEHFYRLEEAAGGLVRNLVSPKDESVYASGEILTVVTEVGSNYARLTCVDGQSHQRVHLDELESRAKRELNAADIISGQVRRCRTESALLMEQLDDLTRRLGVGGVQASLSTGAASMGGLVKATRQLVQAYRDELQLAKEKTIPKLCARINDSNQTMACWVKAETIPLMALAKDSRKLIERIDNRIFNVELYAGLVETVEQVRKGAAAPRDMPVHLMQRRLAMDEESLIGYEAGGFDFQHLNGFDQWLSLEDNFRRVLPYERCVVAFIVRNTEKEYVWAGGHWRDFVTMSFSSAHTTEKNKTTFLYLRNGEQLWRLNIDSFQFDAQLFPDADMQHLTGKLYARNEHFDEWSFITQADYEQRVAADKAARKSWPKLVEDYHAALDAWEAKYAELLDETTERQAFFENRHAGLRGASEFMPKELLILRRAVTHLGRTPAEARKVVPSGQNSHATRRDFILDGTNYGKAERLLWIHSKKGASWTWHADAKELPAKLKGFDLRAVYAEVSAQVGEAFESRPKPPEHPDVRHRTELYGFQPLDDSNINLDAAMAALARQRDKHNRLVLILQGLLDRSQVFAPHPTWRLWEADFERAVVLHHDVSRGLVATEQPPQFVEYQREANESLGVGSLVTGAQAYWRQLQAAERERDVEQHGWSKSSRFMEDENPGPGLVARVVRMTRDKQQAVFEWTRKTETYRGTMRESKQQLKVPLGKLLCIDHYQPGDFKRFFADPRSRASYATWAPFMLAAEDFARGALAEGVATRPLRPWGDAPVKNTR